MKKVIIFIITDFSCASTHTLGEAADIHIPKAPYSEWSYDKEILDSWFDWIVENTEFNQAIIKTSNGKDFWTHVSYKKKHDKDRPDLIRHTKHKYQQST